MFIEKRKTEELILDKFLTQYYCCLVIANFISIGSLWKVLPPGVHDATLKEVERRFVTNKTRKLLFDGFKRGYRSLKYAGCQTIYLNGSYVTDKRIPGDFDACWETIGVDPLKLDPILLDFSDGRTRQKQKYGGEFFPSSANADGTRRFVDFFQIDRYTGKKKGIIRIRIT